MIDLSTRLDCLSDDERMIRDAAADYCARDPELRRVRDLRGRHPSHDPAAWREMAQMGWLGCRVSERFGGMALSAAQVTLVLEQHGRSLAPEPLTAVAVLASGALQHGTNEALKELWLPRLVSGDWLPALAWQGAGVGATWRDDGWILEGTARFVPDAQCADAFIVWARSPEGPGLFLVARDAAGLRVTPHARVDGGTWSDLAFDGVTVGPHCVVALGGPASAALERVLDEGRLALAAELVGLMSRAFEITVDYLKIREQFGQPIGSFQALQHRAADLLVLVELSRAVLRQCAARFDAADADADANANANANANEGASTGANASASTDANTGANSNVRSRRASAASQAKARASDAALQVVKACIQLHGGIGYTDECNIGMFLKRAMVLASWLGGAREHRRRYGQLVQASALHGAASASIGQTQGTLPSQVQLSQAQSGAPADPFREQVRRFLAENFPHECRFPATRLGFTQTAAWQSRLAAHGWMAPGWPVEYGGMGLPAWQQVVMQEEFDRYGVSIVPNNAVASLGPLLIRYGTDEQKRRHLPSILSGQVLWCQGYSEPGAGSDLASLRTRAQLEGDEFVVNGHKIWTSFAHEADMIFMLVRTDPQARKQDGISFLLVDMHSPGITVRRIQNLTGESEFCEVFFDNVRVPRENLVGELHRGWSMAKSLLGAERISIGSPRLAQYPLQLLQSLMIANRCFDDPVARARFDELRLDVDDLRDAFERMTEVLRRGGELGAEVSMLKIWVTETMQRVTDLMLEIQAEQGCVDEPVPLPDGTSVHVAGQYFMSRPATIYGGSNEILKNILARAILGLPG